MTKISIIIPCYNSAKFVSRAIESVIDQTFQDWEILLVNNNSTDNTQEVLEKYAHLYPQKIRVFQESKKGAPLARNKGLTEAKGDWVQFLDADDEILPDKLMGQYELAINKGVSIVAGLYTMIGISNNTYVNTTRGLGDDDLWVALVKSNLGITSANLFNKDLLVKVGGWDENLIASQEYDLMFRMLKHSDAVAYDYRKMTIIHLEIGDSISRGGGNERRQLILDSKIALRLRIREYLEEQDLLTKKRRYLIDQFIYRTLIKNYRYWPDTILIKLKNINLNILLTDKIKGKLFMHKMNLKRFLVGN